MVRKRKDVPVRAHVDTPGMYNVDPSRVTGTGNWDEPVRVTAGGAVPGKPQTSLSLVLGPDGKPIVPLGGTLPDPNRTDAANFLTAGEQQGAQRANATANTYQQKKVAAEPQSQSWLGRIFNTEDTWKPVIGPDGKPTGREEFQGVDWNPLSWTGALWDTGLRGLQWGTDRIAQTTVAGISGLPGGTRTLSWDEAGQVSLGQEVVAAGAADARAALHGGGSLGNAVSALALGGLPAIGGIIAGKTDPNNALVNKDFDITNEQQRTAAFSGGFEKFVSGGADFAFAFADPTILLGAAGKVGRLRYLDVLIDSPEKMTKAVEGVQRGKQVLDANLDALHGTDAVLNGTVSVARDLGAADRLQISPASMFLHNATRVDEGGKKAMSFSDIYNHKVIKYATNRDGVAAALHNAETYDEAALIYRHAIGDATAAEEMLKRRPELLSALVDGERDLVRATLQAHPDKQAGMIADAAARMDRYDAEIEWTKKNLAGSPDLQDRLEFIRQRKNDVAREWVDASNAELTPSAAQGVDDLALAKGRVDRLLAKDDLLKRVVDEAGDGAPSGLYGSLRESVKGFSSDTAFGRWAERTRQSKAVAQSETEAIRGMGFKEAAIWRSTDFEHLNGVTGIARRVLRVWRYAGAEAPSGTIHLAGIGAQESAREVRALLNSVRIYGGKAKTVTHIAEDGTQTVVSVGGALRKEELLTRYVNALSQGGVQGRDDAAKLLTSIENEVKTDLGQWYDYPQAALDAVFSEINKQREALKEQIVETGFWVEGKTENKVPYLETHLQDAEIAPNWRAVEKQMIRSKKADSTIRRVGGSVAKSTTDVYAGFQEVWRPATLLRLGYTQRNVAEGLFRASAFQFSLMPIVDAVRQGGLSSLNVRDAMRYGREGQRGLVGKVTRAAREGTPMPKEFTQWHTAQVTAVDEQIARNHQVVDFAYDQIASESATWRKTEWARGNDQVRSLLDQKAALREELAKPEPSLPKGLTVDDAEAIIERNTIIVDGIYKRMSILAKHTGGDTGPLPDSLQRVADDLQHLTDSIEPMLTAQKQMLVDERSAVSLFRQQTLAKRRLWQGETDVADPDTLRGVAEQYRAGQAFDPNDSYASMALRNLSADHTTRQAMAMQMSTTERLLAHQVTRHHVAVQPGQPGYWPGLATTLNQWKQSEVGRLIIDGLARGRTEDEVISEVASFMRSTTTGREISRFITRSSEHAYGEADAYYVRAAKAEAEAEKSAAPERAAADDARAAMQQAHDDLRAAKAAQRAEQDANPRFSKLLLPDGKAIDEVRHVERAVAARAKAEAAHKAVASKSAIASSQRAVAAAEAEFKAVKAQFRKDKFILNENGNKVRDPEAYLSRKEAAWQDAKQAEKDRNAAVKGREQEFEAAKARVDAARMEVRLAKQDLKARNAANPRTVPLRVDGKTVSDEAKWLAHHEEAMVTAERVYAEKVAANSIPADAKGLNPLLSKEDAVEYADEMVRRYIGLTAGSPEFQRHLSGISNVAQAGADPVAELARVAEQMIGAGAKTSDGEAFKLIPVIGSDAVELGAKGLRDVFRSVASKTFRALGTIPEDTFVRAPFYGRRWQATYDMLRQDLIRQRGDKGLSIRDENMLRDTAHRRALKDTKDWLYTIDRRTLLGQYGEAVVPFISATQNSVTTVGRMVWNNPMVGATMALIWQAPERSGIADKNGNMHFSLPLEWLPQGIRDTVGLQAMQDITFNVDQFNLITPNPGGDTPIPAPGPVVVIPFNMLEKQGVLFSPVAPDMLVSMMGKDTADSIWKTVNDYMYGSTANIESGMSSMPFAVDKALPAWGQKVVDIIRGEGSSASYTSWYDKIYQSEHLKWMSGMRDTPPNPNEISEQARRFQTFRIIANLTAFTPSGYTSQISPVIDTIHDIYSGEPDRAKADQKVYEMFGDIAPSLQQLAKITSTANTAGLQATPDSVRIARNHSDLIGAVAPTLESSGDLDVLGMLGDVKSDYQYDPTVAAWQQSTNIPNTNETYRTVRSPAQAALEAQKSAGWSKYLKASDTLSAIAAGRGLKSLQSKGAEDLLATKKALVESMRLDPRYSGWYSDYQNFSSSRTLDSVVVVKAALGNDGWRKANADSPIWQPGGAADQYMAMRDRVLTLLKQGLSSDQKKSVLLQWQEFRGELGTTVPDWGAKQEKYLAGDDNPEQPQVILDPATSSYTPEQQQSDQMPVYTAQYGG